MTFHLSKKPGSASSSEHGTKLGQKKQAVGRDSRIKNLRSQRR